MSISKIKIKVNSLVDKNTEKQKEPILKISESVIFYREVNKHLFKRNLTLHNTIPYPAVIQLGPSPSSANES